MLSSVVVCVRLGVSRLETPKGDRDHQVPVELVYHCIVGVGGQFILKRAGSIMGVHRVESTLDTSPNSRELKKLREAGSGRDRSPKGSHRVLVRATPFAISARSSV